MQRTAMRALVALLLFAGTGTSIGPTTGSSLESGTLMEEGASWHLGVIVHHPRLVEKMQPVYSVEQLQALEKTLAALGTLEVKQLPTGLPQAGENRENSAVEEAGYDFVWTRDAAFVANAWLLQEDKAKVPHAMTSLAHFYAHPSQMARMRKTIEARAQGKKTLDRPHIKFDGRSLEEMKGDWEHAQNDALGLFLWVAFRAARQGLWNPDEKSLDAVSMLVAYLAALDVTTDKEAGHWEEMGDRKGRTLASSIRSVAGGIQQLRAWMIAEPSRASTLDAALARSLSSPQAAASVTQRWGSFADVSLLNRQLERQTFALKSLLPDESKGPGIYGRRSDLALLTALYVDVTADLSDQLISESVRRDMLQRFLTDLRGSHGDRRYAGDGYWAMVKRETDPKLREKVLNSASLERRLKTMEPRSEPQWTLGTPLLSAIYGTLYRQTGDGQWLRAQTQELNRAVGMVTGPQSKFGEGTLPESYMFVRAEQENAKSARLFTENPLPLNWSKANLALALTDMKKSLQFAATQATAP